MSYDERRDTIHDRRHLNITQLATLIMLALQLAAIVWGAASLKASVDALERAASSLEIETQANRARITDVHTDVEVIKDRLGIRTTVTTPPRGSGPPGRNNP